MNCTGRISRAFYCNEIQAYVFSIRREVAGVIKDSQYRKLIDARKSRLIKVASQELSIEANVVKVESVDLTPENHSHNVKALGFTKRWIKEVLT